MSGLRDLFRPQLLLLLLAFGYVSHAGVAQQDPAQVHHVAGYRLASRVRGELAADRPADSTPGNISLASSSSTPNPWQFLATLPGAFVHDISFASATTGFAVAENGQVWKTTNGGATWSEIVNLGFPYEWFGVHAFNANDVVISGFDDHNSHNGMIRWSHDGGATWSNDIPITTTSWTYRVRFADAAHGMILDSAQTAQITTDGGAAAADWETVNANTDGTWFGDQYRLLPDLHAAAAGIDYCSSADGGATWKCRPSIDSIFDGGAFFVDDNHGWVGGGEISPNVQGWLHRTTDGGQTWSGRVLNAPWPIREIRFVSPLIGWAAGGNSFSGVGGIYFTSDGGQTWSLDVDSAGHEMKACDAQLTGGGYQVWCAGSNGSPNAVIYSVQGAAIPIFSPAPGTFNSSQSVTLSTATPNATIYYTTDGSSPTTASAVYASAIPVSSTTAIQAIAISAGTAPSVLASGTYTIVPPQLKFVGSAPSLTVVAGNAASAQISIQSNATAANVTFSCSGLPAGAQCSFSPSSLTATTQPANVTVTISTSATLASQARNGAQALALLFPGALLLACLLLPGCRRAGSYSILAISLGCGLLATGCGSSAGNRPSPVPVQAAVTVTASSPTAASASTQISLTVDP